MNLIVICTEIRVRLGATFLCKNKFPKYRQNSKMAAKNSKMAAVLVIFGQICALIVHIFWFSFSTETYNLVHFSVKMFPMISPSFKTTLKSTPATDNVQE